MFLKFLRRFSLFSTIFGSFLLIVLLSVTNFNILPFINNMGDNGKIIYSYIIQNKLEHTTNSSIIIACYNLLLYLLSCCPKFNFSVQNANFKSDFTELPSAASPNFHRAKSFYFHIKVDYKNKLRYWIYCLCGGILMKITYPQWIDATEDSSFWNTSQYIDNNNPGVIFIDIHDSFTKSRLKKYSGEIYCKFDLITNLNITSYDEGFIDVSLKPKSKNFIRKSIAYIFIGLFYDLSYNRHEIKISSN